MTDDAALVADLRRYLDREPDARSYVVVRAEYVRLLDLAEEAIRWRTTAGNQLIEEAVAPLRAEVEKLRAVRDAAEAYRTVSDASSGTPAEAHANTMRRVELWKSMCAALDAAKEKP